MSESTIAQGGTPAEIVEGVARSLALLAGPDWAWVDMETAAQAMGYANTARPAENARRWLARHGVTLLRLGKGLVITVGDLRRALQEETARQKAVCAGVGEES